MTSYRDRALDAAVTGMAGRFPGAPSILHLWDAVVQGEVLIGAPPVAEPCDGGVPVEQGYDEYYVPVYGHLDDAERFDAEFFGVTPRDAELMDPQHRLLLEYGWAALEDAGRAPGTDTLVTGVYATASPSTHLRLLLASSERDQHTVDEILLASERDFLATRLAYRLGLRGPAMTVLTACSSSLVAVHLAVQALANGECDQAVVAASSIAVPQGGHLYVLGGVMSGAGACRPFDGAADGTIGGSGVAAIVLRRYDDAVKDGDPIHGVVLGTATNNDGNAKAGFTAPSDTGQRQVIMSALATADVSAETIGYLEAHGTGTKVGDPLEFAAAAAAYTDLGATTGQIALGAVKATIGHLDVAAGLAGLVKALLVTKHAVIPPIASLSTPNPLLDLESSPFRLPVTASPWPDNNGEPRRASVSSFGVGGTNVHVVVEQPPATHRSTHSKPILALVSAVGGDALKRNTAALAAHLRQVDDSPIDIAHTLAVGRRRFADRVAVVGRTREELANELDEYRPGPSGADATGLIFLLPGQGTQRPGMARGFLDELPGFAEAAEAVLRTFEPSLRASVSSAITEPTFPVETLRQTWLAQPALFAVEYAAASALIAIGLEPLALAGHSVGEIVSACLAGVLDLTAAADLVAERGRLMWNCPPGAMLALPCSVDDAKTLLAEHDAALEVAVANTPTDTVVAGTVDEVDKFQRALRGRIACKVLNTSHAFHTSLMAPAIPELSSLLANVSLKSPRIPYVDNVTGELIEIGEVVDGERLANQGRMPVRFSGALTTIQRRFPDALAIEVGPGATLSAMAESSGLKALPMSPHGPADPGAAVLAALGSTWVAGLALDLNAMVEPGRRVHLPGYCFAGPRWPSPASRDNSREATPTQTPAPATAPDIPPSIGDLWSEFLGYKDIPPDADFLDLGGDSLTATRLARRIRQTHGVEVSIADLLGTRTVAGQEELVRGLPKVGDARENVSTPTPTPAPAPAPALDAPLSQGQYAMWIASQMEPANPAYTVPIAMRFKGQLDVPRLHVCLNLLAARHPSLRMRIVLREGAPWQVADPRPLIPLVVHELPDNSVLAERLCAEASKSMGLEDWPYVRATVYRLADDDAVLMLTLHHLVCDGWSLDILATELLDAYCADGPPALSPPGPATPFDYANWEGSPAGETVLSDNLGYWRDQHNDLGDVPEPPFAHPTSDARGAATTLTAELDFAPSDQRQVIQLAKSTGVTPIAVWLAAFAATWHVVTGARQLPIGVPAANRGDERFEHAVGAFATLLPLVVPVDPNTSFAVLAETVAKLLTSGADHAAVPVIDDTTSGVIRPSTHFVLTGYGLDSQPKPDLHVSFVPARVEGTQAALSCLLDEHLDGMHGRMVADTRLYRQADLNRLSEAYQRTLRSVLAHPQRALARLNALAPADHQRILEYGHRTSAPFVGLPYQAFRRWARNGPNLFAVSDADGTSLTYQELESRVARCAALLSENGVHRGSVVGVQLPRCIQYPMAAFALWHLGADVVPLRPEDPAARVREMLAVAGATHLIGHIDYPRLSVPDVCELTLEHLPPEGGTVEPEHVSGFETAYAVFTSGTTGVPKCVALSHASLADELAWRIDEIGLGPGDRVLQTIPLAFDPAFWQCFGPLSAGAGVVFLADDLGAHPAALVSAAIKHEATIVDVVPSLLAAIDDHGLAALPARVVFCGGEPLPKAQVTRYLRLGRGRLYNQYGPSETCIDAAFHHCTPATVDDGEPTVPIGRPVGGTQLYVLGDGLQPVPIGVAGELYVGGTGVAVGYVGSPAATADRFLPNPFAGNGTRMYRTGDRVKWTEQGHLSFIGRLDDQVKVRGHRVEYGEVERALRELPGVHEAAVVVTGRTLARLVAFVTGEPGLEVSDARSQLARRLPTYMIPSETRLIEALPRTNNGKVDRAQLQNKAAQRADRASATSPLSDLAAAVRDVFAAVLDHPDVDLDDDLYSLGGASLGAARVAAALTARLGRTVTLATVLANPKLADLIEAIDDVAPGLEGAFQDAAARHPGQDHVRELERVLGRPAPPILTLVELPRPTDGTAVERAVRQLVARHGALAALGAGSAWTPVVTDDRPAVLADAYWMSGHSEQGVPDDQPGLQAVLLGDQHVLLRLARNRGDGGSANVLAEELRALLSDRSLPEPAALQLDPRPNSPSSHEYWRAALSPPVCMDPWEDLRPATRSFRNTGVRTVLPQRVVQMLAARCARHGWAPSAPYAAALGGLLTKLSKAPAVTVGVPVAHRDDAHRAAVVGRLVDLLPLVLTIGGGPEQAHQALLGSLSHDLPLSRIADLVDDVDLLRRPPVCAAAVMPTDAVEGVVDDQQEDAHTVPEHWADLDLILHVSQNSLTLTGSVDLFDVQMLHDQLAAIRLSLTAWANEESTHQ